MSTQSHIAEHGDKYNFDAKDIKTLSLESNEPTDIKALISCTDQHTSQWFIERFIQKKYYIHSFAGLSSNFNFIKNRFRLNDANEITADLLYDEKHNIYIEKASIAQIDNKWINDNKYNEYFDIILDEAPCDNIIKVDIDNHVQTTIFGNVLKKTGVIYVVAKKLQNDIVGEKLRTKIGRLYPNTHFELMEERDTPWTTQFIFLKVESCDNLDTNRDNERVDVRTSMHYQYNQDHIKGETVTNLHGHFIGSDNKEGMDKVWDALEEKQPQSGFPKWWEDQQ